MPIKPENKALYPPNWSTKIRPAILDRANHQCENCGIPNYATGYRDKTGKWYSSNEIMDALEDHGYDYFDNELEYVAEKKPTTIRLTIAHKDHDPTHCDGLENDHVMVLPYGESNLAAWCQKCHLNYDQDHHQASARKTREEKKRQISLW